MSDTFDAEAENWLYVTGLISDLYTQWQGPSAIMPTVTFGQAVVARLAIDGFIVIPAEDIERKKPVGYGEHWKIVCPSCHVIISQCHDGEDHFRRYQRPKAGVQCHLCEYVAHG